MKIIFCVILAFFSLDSLSSCMPSNEIELSHEYISTFMENISVNEVVFSDFTLPSTIQDLPITWETDNEDVVIENGTIKVNRDESNKEVTLTGYTTFEDVEYIRELFLFIPSNEFDEFGSIEEYIEDPGFILNYVDYRLKNENNYVIEANGSTEGSVKLYFGTYDVKQDISSTTHKFEDIRAYDITSQTDKSPAGDIDVYQKGIFTESGFSFSHARAELDEVTPIKRSFTLDSYIETYGVSPFCHFTGYNILENDIISADYEQQEENHLFTYTITPGDCSINKAQQISVFGKLEDVNISSIQFSLLIDSEFNLLEMNSTEIFKASMESFTASLTQNIKTTYTRFDPELIKLEDLDFARYTL